MNECALLIPIHQGLFQSWDIVKLAGLVGITYVLVNENLGPLNCRGRAVTFVATKVTKKAFSRKASLPHEAFALQIRQNLGCKMLRHFSFAQPHASATIAMPFPTLVAIIVLPDFARSCSADGKHKKTGNIK